MLEIVIVALGVTTAVALGVWNWISWFDLDTEIRRQGKYDSIWHERINQDEDEYDE